jgi:Rieske Fe-S protein
MAIDRRTLIAGCASLAACPGAVARSRLTPQAYPNRPIKIDDMAPGEWRLIMVLGRPIYVHRSPTTKRAPGRGEYTVLSGVCTHASCQISPAFGVAGGLGCPCHGSRFDAEGAVVRGPAVRRLDVPPHVVRDGSLTIEADR